MAALTLICMTKLLFVFKDPTEIGLKMVGGWWQKATKHLQHY